MFEIISTIELLGEEAIFAAISAEVHQQANLFLGATSVELGGPFAPVVFVALHGYVHRRVDRELSMIPLRQRLDRRWEKRRQARARRAARRASGRRVIGRRVR